jgi:poly-gamma-glutamate system protein
MKLRTERIPTHILILIAVFACIMCWLALKSRQKYYAPNFGSKIAAVKLTQQMMDRIKEKRIADGVVPDPINDPNQSGLIGYQHSLITTEYGDLESKLTSLNPNFAALIIQQLADARVKTGDAVAVSFTGSFPALNLAVLAACEALDLRPVIITSVGASMWGANDPEFTYLDQEKFLFETGLLKYRSRRASLGGVDDLGRGLSPEGRDLLVRAIARSGLEGITAQDLDGSVRARMEIYLSLLPGERYDAFINVGGGAAALGGVDLPSGIIEPNQNILNRGVAGEFLRRNIPVINFSDISRLARLHNLPIAPIPLPPLGRGKLFYEFRYSVPLAAIFAAVMLIIIFMILRLDVDHYLKRTFKKGV